MPAKTEPTDFSEAGASVETADAAIERVYSNPVLVSPNYAKRFLSYAGAALTREEEWSKERVGPGDEFWPEEGHWMARYRPYRVSGGVLTVPIEGALLNNWGFHISGLATGYTYIRRAVERGVADSNVTSIALVIDSPGGEAAGNFELVDWLKEQSESKPIHSVVTGAALSGGYSIATVGRDLTISPSSVTGSVGVFVMHTDMSEQLKSRGIQVTFIKFGDRKVEANSFEPLTDEAKARIQARVDKIGARFVSTVANNRAISEADVRGTEAGVFDADESLELNFADRVGDPDETIEALRTDGRRNGDHRMSGSEDGKTFTQADIDAAVEAAKAESAAASESSVGDARKEERERYAAVTSSEEFKGREELANSLLSTDMTADQIIGHLAKAPKAQSKGAGFEGKMDAEAGHEAGANGDDGEVSAADRIKAAYTAAGGRLAKRDA